MKVVFKGSPAKVKEEMIAFLLSFPAQTTAVKPPEKCEADSVAEPEQKPAPEVAPAVQGESEPSPTSSESVCKFCAKYTGGEGWVRRHERHCKSNPERVPHPKEGQPPPWMKPKSQADPNSSGNSEV